MLPTSAGVEPATSWSPVGGLYKLSINILQFDDQKEQSVVKSINNEIAVRQEFALIGSAVEDQISEIITFIYFITYSGRSMSESQQKGKFMLLTNYYREIRTCTPPPPPQKKKKKKLMVTFPFGKYSCIRMTRTQHWKLWLNEYSQCALSDLNSLSHFQFKCKIECVS